MPTVRPVRLDDEPTSTARPTRTDAYALRTGEPIQVTRALNSLNDPAPTTAE